MLRQCLGGCARERIEDPARYVYMYQYHGSAVGGTVILIHVHITQEGPDHQEQREGRRMTEEEEGEKRRGR